MQASSSSARHAAAVSLAVSLFACLTTLAWAQPVQIDRGVRAAGLWCFPIANDDNQYVYLPAAARLGQDESGHPQFSFLRYAVETEHEGAGTTTITKAGGGGVLHFLVLYDTPEEAVRQAQQELRKTLKKDEVVLRGPIVFKDGHYALVSSILNPADGSTARKLLATGRAPVLEGSRIALAFDLKPDESSLLMQSFAMDTPDVSLVFDMTFEGLTDAFEAELTIDWAEVRKSASFSAGGTVYYVSADLDLAIDELFRSNAIKLKTAGADAASEALLRSVYDRLIQILFRPVEPERVPADQQGGLMSAINALINQRDGPLSSRKTTGFGAYVGYQLKEMRSEGRSVLDFNHRASVERHSLITFNLGDLYRRFGRDPNYFRAVNAADPTFLQREVHVSLDGALLPDFDRYINSVTLTLRKQHETGKETIKELVIDRALANKPAAFPPLVYGWSGDEDRLRWLQYDYRMSWMFKGGGMLQTEWKRTDAPMVDLFAPYERRVVRVTGADAPAIKAKGVRVIIVQIEYPFFGERRRAQMVVKPGTSTEEPWTEITLPQNQFDYEYSITWSLDQDRRLTRRGRDSSGFVFVDDLPAPSAPADAFTPTPSAGRGPG